MSVTAGMRPPKPILSKMKIAEAPVLMEDHDKALAAWQRAGVRQSVLVHVDAHIDFGWIPGTDLDEIDPQAPQPMLNPLITPRRRMLTIGNYIYPAIKQGIVKKFYWVVPEPTFSSVRGRRYILKQLQLLSRCGDSAAPTIRSGVICCRLAGCELVVCTLGSLEVIGEPVLLDIDVDFLLTPQVWNDLDPHRLPWIMPEELWERLSGSIADVRLLTIAYSVEGGYTPLRFKYLGDDLAQLSRGKQPATAALKRQALAFERRRQWAQACAVYRSAAEADPHDASLAYTLCALFLQHRVGDRVTAAGNYRRALILDRTYTTSYNNRGILYLQQGKTDRALLAYREFLAIDGGNPSVFNGLGHVFLEQKRFSEALTWFDRCLAEESTHAAALLGKALVLIQQGGVGEAVVLLEGLSRLKPDDAQSFYWLGRIYQRQHRLAAACDCFKQAVMRGWAGPGIHLRLAWLYLRRRMFLRLREECLRALEEVRRWR